MPSASGSGVFLEKKGKLLIIKFNNPKKKNALSRTAYVEIAAALNQAATDDSITVVALTGVGDFYSSGNDLTAEMGGGSDMDEVIQKAKENLTNLIRAFYEFPKLLIAVVNGPCIGIAATTAALCDVIYCSEAAYFFTPFTNLGLCAEGCSSYTFPRILGTSKATEMLLLNHKMSAKEALQFHFVAEVFKPAELESKLWPRIVEFSNLPIESVKVGKKLIKCHQKEQLHKALAIEIDELYKRFYSDEFLTAVSKFMSKKSKL